MRKQAATLGNCANRPDSLRCGLAGFAWDDHSFDISEYIMLGIEKKKRLFSILSAYVYLCISLYH